jgi:hypothetical protein
LEDLGRAVAALEADLVRARRAARALVEVDEEVAGPAIHEIHARLLGRQRVNT